MIEPMQMGDAPVVAGIDAEVFGVNAWSEDAWREELRAVSPGDRRYIVFRARGAVLGYAGILRAGSDADVLTVAVAAGVRREGIGRRLVEELLRVARGWQCRAVHLEVEEGNLAATAMYGSLGFTTVGTRRHYYGPGRHAVTMRAQVREPWGSMPLESGPLESGPLESGPLESGPLGSGQLASGQLGKEDR